MITTTPGQLLVNADLPEDLRDYTRVLDKKGVSKLLSQVHEKYPDRYKDILRSLQVIGAEIAHREGGSFSIKDLLTTDEDRHEREILRKEIDQLLDAGKPESEIIKLVSSKQGILQSRLIDRLKREKNPLSDQVVSGTRGNPVNLRSIFVGDLLVSDNRDRPIPIPILHGYSEGLDPAEYWAGSYGVRKGVVETKLSTADAGAWGKQTAQAAHHVKVTDSSPAEGTGVPVETDDQDLVGYVLAEDVGDIKRGTIITPRLLPKLQDQRKRVLVHSAVEGIGADGGVPPIAAGIRERGKLPAPGENIGLLAAQAIGEKLSQLQLSSKHAGGVIGISKNTPGGFELINNLVQVPKTFRGASVVSSVDGRVEQMVKAPQGGHYLYVNGVPHYIEPDVTPSVQPGDAVEAGDLLTPGIPNPAEIVKHKGIGEGRRQFAKYFMEAYKNAGLPIHRRNAEVLARGLINTIQVTGDDTIDGALPDDYMEYDDFAAKYKPRLGAQDLPVKSSAGKYLERPVLHYSIGTRVTPSVTKTLEEFKVPQIHVHSDPPPFEPHMKRAMEVLSVNPDWLVRFGGSYQERGLLEAAHRGRTSTVGGGKSFIPDIVAGVL